MAKIWVGCCGFSMSKKKYYEMFEAVEIQETFYNLPSKSRMEKWRAESPQNFIFTMKAWQVITHPRTSPTWRRLKGELRGDPNNYGFLRPTKENIQAWEDTLEIAKAVGAKAIVLQLPPKLELKESTYKDISEFLSKISWEGFLLAIEPRNKTWDKNRDMVKSLFEKFNIIHCVDIFKRQPVDTGEAYYIRLHGLGGEINYRYKYTDQDLKRLKNLVTPLLDANKDVFVMFNNIYMTDDALRFKRILTQS